jgi:hypothetical protein
VRFGVPSQVRAYAVNNLAPSRDEEDEAEIIRTQGLSSAALFRRPFTWPFGRNGDWCNTRFEF